MGFLLDALWRMTTRTHHHIKWFCYDKPNRIKNGHVPDGLYEHERSATDKERIGLKEPDERQGCHPKMYKGKCGIGADATNMYVRMPDKEGL